MALRRQSSIHAVQVDDALYDLKDDAALSRLEQEFARTFGERATVWDLIEAFETLGSSLTLDRLVIRSFAPDLVETMAEFSQRHSRGTCSYFWRRHADGSVERTRDAELRIQGSRARLALQIHANMVTFARQLGKVSTFEVEARQIGRYAYRFLHGVEVDAATRAEVGRRLEEHAKDYGVPFDSQAYARLRSPHQLASFIVLDRVQDAWMRVVDQIIERQGYDFTVDQVVDLARRPGLAMLVDQPAYAMRLDVTDDLAVARFHESVRLGRRRKALQRLRGVLGLSFQQLPRLVRHALIVYRPYVFPRPRTVHEIPDLAGLTCSPPPCRVVGFHSEDGLVVAVEAADPEGTRVRDYRAREVRQVVEAIDAGVEIVSVTGLSGAGKTEVLSWQVERMLSSRGHRVVCLDAQKLRRSEDVAGVLTAVDDVVRPTVTLFDESLYIRGEHKAPFVAFAERFLKWPGQHLIFVGGGLLSPEGQRRAMAQELEGLWESRRTAHVPLLPKAINRCQAYRFLGLARLGWATEAERQQLLVEILRRYPPFFVPLMPIRLYEHLEVDSFDKAMALIEANVVPEEWEQLAGMVLQRRGGGGEP